MKENKYFVQFKVRDTTTNQTIVSSSRMETVLNSLERELKKMYPVGDLRVYTENRSMTSHWSVQVDQRVTKIAEDDNRLYVLLSYVTPRGKREVIREPFENTKAIKRYIFYMKCDGYKDITYEILRKKEA